MKYRFDDVELDDDCEVFRKAEHLLDQHCSNDDEFNSNDAA
jgi:hypothetical protein